MNLAFRPAAGANAVESCSLAIRLPSPVDDAVFSAITARAAELAALNDLPARSQLEAPQFFIAFGTAPSFPTSNTFQRYAANGTIEVELKCEPQLLTFTVRTYAGWTDFYATVAKVFLPLLPLYLSVIPAISSIGLQYDNAFIAETGAENVVAGEMFRDGTKWVAIYDRESSQPWHSHFGIFLPSGENNRHLINVNVTVSDQLRPPLSTPHRTAGLSILTADVYDIPGRLPLVVEAGREIEIVDQIAQHLHKFQRQILGEVLSDTYLAAIGC